MKFYAQLKDLFRRSALVSAMGSTLVSSSLPGLLSLAEKAAVTIFFFGTSIAGSAELMKLKLY